jgi:hypothetical protein
MHQDKAASHPSAGPLLLRFKRLQPGGRLDYRYDAATQLNLFADRVPVMATRIGREALKTLAVHGED